MHKLQLSEEVREEFQIENENPLSDNYRRRLELKHSLSPSNLKIFDAEKYLIIE